MCKDLYNKVYFLVRQIPEGKVSTYNYIAITLHTSPRTIGKILSKNRNLKSIPCYRVVMSDGRIGGYVKGIKEKRRLLEKDGISIKKYKIENLEAVLFKEFKIN